jgi:hypothetical protein
MRHATTAPTTRQGWLRWVSVVAIALSMLVMHQLSSNHQVAEPLPVSTKHIAGPGHTDHHDEVDSRFPADGAPVLRTAALEADEHCPGCGAHHAMLWTCLAALVLLTVALVLSGPLEWRGLRIRRRPSPIAVLPWRTSRRPSLTPVELSVSRT